MQSVAERRPAAQAPGTPGNPARASERAAGRAETVAEASGESEEWSEREGNGGRW